MLLFMFVSFQILEEDMEAERMENNEVKRRNLNKTQADSGESDA